MPRSPSWADPGWVRQNHIRQCPTARKKEKKREERVSMGSEGLHKRENLQSNAGAEPRHSQTQVQCPKQRLVWAGCPDGGHLRHVREELLLEHRLPRGCKKAVLHQVIRTAK